MRRGCRSRLPRAPAGGFRPALALALAAALLAVPSLAGQVKTSAARGVDFSAYRSWDWKPLPENHMEVAPEVERAIREETARSLARAGLEHLPDGEADLLVSFTGYITDQLTVEGIKREIAPGVSWVGHPDAHAMWGYKEGTLVLEIHDRARGEIVWSGWASEVGKTVEKLRRKAGPVTRKILRHFPPD